MLNKGYIFSYKTNFKHNFMKEGYIPKELRKKILFISDDPNLYSGVACMAREIINGTSHKYNYINIAAGIDHPYAGQRIDISEQINKSSGNTDSSVILYPHNGYGDVNIMRQLMKSEKPDAIMIFTDPRFYQWLFQIENEIRKQCPIMYYNIWDELPLPLWNKSSYDSCDALFGISKQTVNINKMVLGDLAKDKVIKFCPHGINEDKFYPIEDTKLIEETKKSYFNGQTPKFVTLFNSRNIRRKCPSDLMAAWKLFQDKLTPEQQKDTALLLHTDVIDGNGTDLGAVREAIFGKKSNVYFTHKKLDDFGMNLLYNISDVTCLPSSNEGWGLSLTESMMAGKMIIANVTGGMQDQMRFQDKDGKWIEFSEEFPSNHYGTYKECGEWAIPVFPNNLSLVGSPSTPYIWDTHLDFRDLAKSIEKVYNLHPEERNFRGLKGREWVLSEESMMSAKNMCKNMIEGIDETLKVFKPRKSFELIKVEEMKENKINHPLVY